MRIRKKLAWMVLALLMTFGLFHTAFAAGTDGGSITVSDAAAGERYTIYQIFTLSFAAQPSAYSYQVTPDWAAFFADGAEGASYVTVDQRGYVTSNDIEGNEQAFARAALSFAESHPVSNNGTAAADQNGTVLFEGLPLGYYLVQTTQGSLCALTSTDPDAVIEEKWTSPTLEKEICEDDYLRKEEGDGNLHEGENSHGEGWGTWNDADNGQAIAFRLTLHEIGGAVNLTVHDCLEEGLTLAGINHITLYQNAGDTEGRDLTAGPDYTLTQTTCSDSVSAVKACSFEIRFGAHLFETLQEEAYLVITYQAGTDTHAASYTDYQDAAFNHAWLTSGMASRTPVVTTETDLFGFGVYKYRKKEEEQTALAGASFILAKGSGGKKQYALFASETNETDGNLCYLITGWTDNAGDASTLTSGTDGMIRILGLDDDAYLLTETEAPDGYNPLADPIALAIDETGRVTYALAGSNEQKEAAEHVIPIENLTGARLPGTGGIGRTIFYIVGVILVLAAGILLVVRRKMNRPD